jgi:hypothetical protein
MPKSHQKDAEQFTGTDLPNQVLFPYLSSVTLADSEKKPSGKPFHHHQFDLTDH